MSLSDRVKHNALLHSTSKHIQFKESISLPHGSLEKSSLHDPHTDGKRHRYLPPGWVRGSYTVEAAILLPLFLMFSVLILFIAKVIFLQWKVENVMTDIASQIALTGEAPDEFALDALFLADVAASKAPVSAVRGGIVGFDLSKTTVDGNNIRFCVDYSIKIPFYPFRKQGFRISQSQTARIWNGFDATEEQDDMIEVYVTPYGKAYHLSRYCAYIDPSIMPVGVDELSEKRNGSGGRYGACSLCGKYAVSRAYITTWGDSYHGRITCSGLKRTVSKMSLKKAKEKYHACAKCG